jgi:hypothetical protein
MKRKNILWGFAVLVVAMVCCYVFSACGDDKEEPQDPLLGAWEYVHNPEATAALGQMLAQTLQENQALTPDNIQLLTRVKEIIETTKFVVQLNADGTARLYAYPSSGIGPFVSGTWQMTEQALLLQAGNLTLGVTNIRLEGTNLYCMLGDLPLTFKKYTK